MFQLPFATSQAAANLAQRMRPPQLAKQHGHKLAPTGETPRVPLCLVLLDCFLEISARKQFQHLRENAAYFVHRLSLLRSNWFLLEPNPTYQGLSLSPLGTYVSYPLIWTAVNLEELIKVRGQEHNANHFHSRE